MAQRSPYPVSSYYQPPQAPPRNQPLAQGQPGHPPAPVQPVSAPAQHPVQPVAGGPVRYPTQPVRPVAYAPQAKPQSRHVLVAGGSMLALAALIITPKLSQPSQQLVEPFTCIKQEQAQALVSRDQLKALLATELQSPKAQVQEMLKQPFCVLSPGTTTAGQPADREAYPLEFDPQTWLVVLYEGDRYAGYDFRFR